ncbi:unnamed protein product, partial [Oppiella nova]
MVGCLTKSDNYLLIVTINYIILFWVPSVVMSLSADLICDRIPGLTPKQLQICHRMPQSLAIISSGVRMATNECQRQFRHKRWNCSVTSGPNLFTQVMFRASVMFNEYLLVELIHSVDKFHTVLSSKHMMNTYSLNAPIIGSREASYSYAIRSAGVTYAVSEACSRGSVSFCGCHRIHSTGSSESALNRVTNDSSWKWSGCTTNVRYGIQMARSFMDDMDNGVDRDVGRALMNLHNNNAGRKCVKDLLISRCKCHGVSGSCTARTCWHVLPAFHTVGDRLVMKYNSARRVAVHYPHRKGRSRKHRHYALKVRRITVNDRRSHRQFTPKPRDLVYFDKSVNYCDKNPLMDSTGTQGRACNKSSDGDGSCESMCCGRGYLTNQYVRTWKCRCRFHFCCQVTCTQCSQPSE